MTVKSFRIHLLLLFTLITSGFAQSDSFRIATVDMTALFKAHPETAVAEARLDADKKAARTIFEEKKQAMESVLSDHREVTQALITSGASASEEMKTRAATLLDEASKLEKELATMQTTQSNDLKSGFIAERQRILGLIQTEIQEYNADGRYDLIMDLSATSANGIPRILHAPGAEDITEAIKQLFLE